MKKLIILLAVCRLSSLRASKTTTRTLSAKRPVSESARCRRAPKGAPTGAANGWLMEYYPSATQEYGGIAIYMKFQNGTVTVTSEAEGAGKTAESLYSYDYYGPTITDTSIRTSISIRSRTPVSARPIRVWEATASSSS